MLRLVITSKNELFTRSNNTRNTVNTNENRDSVWSRLAAIIGTTN